MKRLTFIETKKRCVSSAKFGDTIACSSEAGETLICYRDPELEEEQGILVYQVESYGWSIGRRERCRADGRRRVDVGRPRCHSERRRHKHCLHVQIKVDPHLVGDNAPRVITPALQDRVSWTRKNGCSIRHSASSH